MQFDKYQLKAINLAMDKRVQTLFISGVAGSGKSAIIKEITNRLNKKAINYELLAPTNSASKNINGKTLHKYFKIKPYENINATKEDDFILFDNFDLDLEYNDSDLILIVDEVSMVGKELLSKTLENAEYTKMILFGDLEQLPPVKDKKVDYSKYCKHHVHLEKNYRATNPIVAGYIKEFRDFKVINENIKTFKAKDFDDDTYIIGYTNRALSEMIDKLGVNERAGTKVILFNAIYTNGDKLYDNGDVITLGKRDINQLSKHFTIYYLDIGFYDKNIKYPPKVIVGDYDKYKEYLNDKFNTFTSTMKNLISKYNVKNQKDVWQLYKTDRLQSFDFENLKNVYRDYINIKNIPYARHHQFITSYKAQGKAYKKVVVLVDDIRDDDNMYVAMSRAVEDLKLCEVSKFRDIENNKIPIKEYDDGEIPF